HDDTSEYLAELGRREFLMRAQRRPSLLGVTWWVDVEREGLRGKVGIDAVALRSWSPGESRRAQVEVLVESRELCRVEERAWLPGLSASIEWDTAPADRSWTVLAGSTQPLRDALDAAQIELVLRQARGHVAMRIRPDEDTRRLLWLGVAAPFLAPTLYAAWRALRRDA
ncbi:MAG: hypothetical protein KC457_37645, partial [Myxococcales bacterium]|nr:hypothetical protein [Myxococcales bacterium]